MTGDDRAGRQRVIEHARDARLATMLDRVDYLPALIASADDEDHIHGSARGSGREPWNGGIVAWPVLETPWPINTLRTVRRRISRSSRNDRCSTYQTSSANFSSHDNALRPFTWAH